MTALFWTDRSPGFRPADEPSPCQQSSCPSSKLDKLLGGTNTRNGWNLPHLRFDAPRQAAGQTSLIACTLCDAGCQLAPLVFMAPKGASMRVRLSCLVLGALLVPILAYADNHNADYYGGLSFGNGGSILVGFDQAFAKARVTGSPCKPGYTFADIGAHFGEHEGQDVTQFFYLTGPRCTFTKRDGSRNLVHAQFLFGGVHSNDGQAGPNDGAVAVGVAFDRVLADHPTPQTRFPGLGIRVQFNQIWRIGDDRESISRLSVGLLYRFPRNP